MATTVFIFSYDTYFFVLSRVEVVSLPKMSTPRIVELSDTIHSSIEAIRDFLRAGDVPFPSFDADAPTAFPERISAYRDAVLDATAELHDLLLEPLNLLYRHGAVSLV